MMLLNDILRRLTKLLCLILFLSVSIAGVASTKSKKERLKKYQDGISSMNLLNGLHLSRKQTSRLLDLNRDIKLMHDAVENSDECKNLKKNAEQSMKALYQYLKYNPNKEDTDIQHKASRDDHKYKSFLKRKKKELNRKWEKILEEAEEILTPAQLEVVATFHACVVPPSDLRDPVRAGQAKQASGIMRQLLRIRRLRNKKDVKKRSEHLADRLVDTTHKYYKKMTAEQMKKKHREIIKQLKQVYEMKETTFELQKDDIVAQLEPNRDSKKKYDSPEYMAKHKTYKLKRFLLMPDVMIPVLTARLKNEQRGGLR